MALTKWEQEIFAIVRNYSGATKADIKGADLPALVEECMSVLAADADKYRQSLATQAPAVGAEPVAWQVFSKANGAWGPPTTIKRVADDLAAAGHEVRPLYPPVQPTGGA